MNPQVSGEPHIDRPRSSASSPEIFRACPIGFRPGSPPPRNS